MTVKFNHAPGSDLPWRSEEDERGIGRLGRSVRLFSGRRQVALFQADGHGFQGCDAAFATHAINNYARLVRCVRDRATLQDGDAERALLRMIGEEEV